MSWVFGEGETQKEYAGQTNDALNAMKVKALYAALKYSHEGDIRM